MITPDSHNTVVNSQFGPKANAYLTSVVHANGEDLEQMVALVGQRPDAIALDLGCGGGHAAFRLAPLVGKEAARRGLDNMVTKPGAAETLSCPDASFDVAVTRYSTHHWRDAAAGLAQMHRVLKPGGQAIFMDVISPGVPLLDTWLQGMELLRDPSHVRNASLAQWSAFLSAAGFSVGHVKTFRLRLEFASWVERMKTPATHVAAIRSLQQGAASEVIDYFEIEADGSFTVDTVLIAASA
jgi:SAM-dependent methyltransferase